MLPNLDQREEQTQLTTIVERGTSASTVIRWFWCQQLTDDPGIRVVTATSDLQDLVATLVLENDAKVTPNAATDTTTAIEVNTPTVRLLVSRSSSRMLVTLKVSSLQDDRYGSKLFSMISTLPKTLVTSSLHN